MGKTVREMLEYQERRDIERKIERILYKMGVKPHYRGRDYIVESVINVLRDPESIQQVTKVLYPDVAKKLNTTASRVERDIRNAIEESYKQNIDETDIYWEDVFGMSVYKRPTNRYFIAALVDYIERTE